MTYYNRKSARIPNYDYSRCNYYFVTICTHEHNCLFGKPSCLNKLGHIVDEDLRRIPDHYDHITIDKYVIMPNHVHMILIIGDGENNPNLNQIIAQYKSGVTRKIREYLPDQKVWQRSYHDHVIRNQAGYEKIWMYIENNPLKWEEDCFYCKRFMDAGREGQDPPLR